MQKFLKPWWRKLGIGMLVMACIFMAGWVRSLVAIDILSTEGRESEAFVSSPHVIAWWSSRYGDGVRVVGGWESHPSTTWAEGKHPHDKDNIRWHWRRFGFGNGEMVLPDFRMTYRYIPYWSIVIPLTGLSALLLFSKPCPSNQKTISEPIPSGDA